MKDAWKKYLTVRAPHYTSYPSALDFDDRVDDRAYGVALAGLGLYEPLTLYAHIPFCRRLCGYCGCNMQVESRYERARDYVDTMRAELRLLAGEIGGAGRPASLHFGGGTPNFLEAEDIAAILDAVEAELGLTDNVKLSIEIDPRLVEDGDISALAGLGFSRMSLRVQDIAPDDQSAINWVQPFETVERVLADMRAAGVDDVSFDLLYGLPKQTLAGFGETIDEVIALAPDRLAVFGCAHLPSSLRRQRLIDETTLPGEVERAELAELADEKLRVAGYARIGFDHYAKPGNSLWRAHFEGTLRRSFQGFTDEIGANSIGFGASAVSFVGGVYAQNAKDIAIYSDAVAAGRLPIRLGARRSARDAAYARLIESLLCRGRADISGFEEADGAIIRRVLEPLVRDGVVSASADEIVVSEEAWGLRLAVAAFVDPRLDRPELPARAV
jgi:oxygen-independent coproporphyrinogen-3 oxidase